MEKCVMNIYNPALLIIDDYIWDGISLAFKIVILVALCIVVLRWLLSPVVISSIIKVAVFIMGYKLISPYSVILAILVPTVLIVVYSILRHRTGQKSYNDDDPPRDWRDEAL